MTDMPGRIVGRIGSTPLVDIPQTDVHPWWACECAACEADRRMFLGDTVPTHTVEAAKKLILIRGERKW